MKIAVDFAALVLLYITVLYKKWNAKGKDVLLVNTLMYFYLSFVLFFTLMPVITSLPFIFNHSYAPMNLNPFDDVFNGRGDFLRQVVLNGIMLFPFGFLYPMLKRKHIGFIKTVFAAFLLSLCIELLQPLINGVRSADITDLITNTFGAILGYGAYILFKPVTEKILNTLKKDGASDEHTKENLRYK